MFLFQTNFFEENRFWENKGYLNDSYINRIPLPKIYLSQQNEKKQDVQKKSIHILISAAAPVCLGTPTPRLHDDYGYKQLQIAPPTHTSTPSIPLLRHRHSNAFFWHYDKSSSVFSFRFQRNILILKKKLMNFCQDLFLYFYIFIFF